MLATSIGIPDSPYLTLEEGARHCRFDVTAPSEPVECFRRWLIREGIPLAKRGRRVLVRRSVLDAALEKRRR